MKSFTDKNKVKTNIGDMVSFDGEMLCGQKVEGMFIVESIRKNGSKVEAVIENQVNGTFIVRTRSLINEM